MAKFNFDTFNAGIDKQRADKQAQIEAQQATQQVDQQAQQPLAQPAQQLAPAQPQQATSQPAQGGFNVDEFLGRGDTFQPQVSPVQAEASEQILSAQQPEVSSIFKDDRARELLGKLGGEIPAPEEAIGGELPDTFGLPGESIGAAGPSVAQQAMAELRGLGVTDEEVASALAFQAGTKEKSILPQAAGGIGGSLAATAVLGRLIPGPIDDIGIFLGALKTGGQIVGAASGATAGSAIQTAIDPDRDINLGELAKVFGTEAVIEAGSLGVGRLINNMFRGGIRGAAPNAKELSELITKKAKEALPDVRKPVGLLPGQIAPDQPVASGLDSIVSKGIFSQRADAQFRILQKVGAKQAGDTILEGFLPGIKALSPEESFTVLSDIVSNRRSVPKIMASKLYERVDDIVKSSAKTKTIVKNVPTGILDDAGKPITRAVSEEVTVLPSVDISSITTKLKADLELIEGAIGADNQKLRLIKETIAKGKNLSFAETQESITNLGEIVNSAGDLFTKNPRLKRSAAGIKKSLEAARDVAFDKLPGDARNIANKARKLWSTTSKKFDNQTVQELFRNLEKDPASLERFFSSQSLPRIKEIQSAIGEKAFNRVSKNFAEGMISKAGTVDAGLASDGKGLLMGDSILRSLNENEDVARHVLGKSYDNVKNTARAISLVQKTDTQGVAAFRMIQLGSAMALVGGGFGAEEAGGKKGLGAAGTALATTILLGPKVLGALSRSPKFAKLLTEGRNVGPATKEAIQIGSRLVRLINDTRKNINKEDARLEKQAQEVGKQAIREQRPPVKSPFKVNVLQKALTR